MVYCVEKQIPSTMIEVRVQPKASRTSMVLEPDGRIRVALTAPPVEGAANAALREFMAKVLGVARTSVVLVKGEKSRDKTLCVNGLGEKKVNVLLAVYVSKTEKRTK
jgi:uncharacterized protein